MFLKGITKVLTFKDHSDFQRWMDTRLNGLDGALNIHLRKRESDTSFVEGIRIGSEKLFWINFQTEVNEAEQQGGSKEHGFDWWLNIQNAKWLFPMKQIFTFEHYRNPW